MWISLGYQFKWDELQDHIKISLLEEIVQKLLTEQKLNKHSISGKRPEQDLRDFFLWAVRVAKIEVIDAENAIELKGYWKEDAPLVPVLNLDELIQEYQAACASGAVDKTVRVDLSKMQDLDKDVYCDETETK